MNVWKNLLIPAIVAVALEIDPNAIGKLAAKIKQDDKT